MARKLGVERDVLFLGNQDCMEELLPLADVFLLPSSSESFGLVALEAMSAEVPVVASNAGGLPEVVEEGSPTPTSDSSTRRRRNGRKLKILKKETKRMPKEVDE